MYDWGDLKVFAAVARQGSTLAASHDLRMNQTTVARRIAALEKALGVCLFEKLQSGYRLSAIGAELLPWAQKIEQDAETIARLASQRSRSVAGTIRVTTNEPFANFFLTPALVEFGELYPGVAIRLIIEDRPFDLMRGEADVAIRAGARPTEAGLVLRSLGTAGWSFYCSRLYAQRRGVPGSLAELQGHALLGGEGRLAQAPAMRAVDDVPGAVVVSRSNSLTNQVVGVRAGLGIGPLPCLLGDGDAELIRCFPPLPEYSGEVMLVTRADLKDVPHIRAFNEFVVNRMAALRHRMEGSAALAEQPITVQPI